MAATFWLKLIVVVALFSFVASASRPPSSWIQRRARDALRKNTVGGDRVKKQERTRNLDRARNIDLSEDVIDPASCLKRCMRKQQQKPFRLEERLELYQSQEDCGIQCKMVEFKILGELGSQLTAAVVDTTLSRHELISGKLAKHNIKLQSQVQSTMGNRNVITIRSMFVLHFDDI